MNKGQQAQNENPADVNGMQSLLMLLITTMGLSFVNS